MKRRGRLLEFVCAYDFHNEHGELIFQKLRYRLVEGDGRDKELFYRQPRGEYSWSPRKPWNADAYLYRLPDVLRAVRQGRAIWWVEGEKDAEVARGHGLIATSHHGGAGKVFPEQCRWLTGAARVYVVADRDVPGYYDAACRLDGLMLYAGLAREQIKVLHSPAGNDLADHYAAGLGRRDWRVINEKWLREQAAKHSAQIAAQHGYGWVGAL
ncbi:hypothetical protein V6U81_10595 [Micromonospora sp. CPCC 205711]|uniref:hypothetical protein n=1 Tax=Micromonospora sp. CPCC 205547 TaxID=3122400 RepID=UPI002FF1960E